MSNPIKLNDNASFVFPDETRGDDEYDNPFINSRLGAYLKQIRDLFKTHYNLRIFSPTG